MKRIFGYITPLAVAILLVISLLIVSCGEDKNNSTGGTLIVSTVQAVSCPTGTASNVFDIAMQGNLFIPSVTEPPLSVNTIVRWTNNDITEHHVYRSYADSASGWFESDFIGQGQSVCFKFSAAGTYPYRCVGEGMTGTIIVQ